MSVIVVLREGPHAKSWPPFSGQNEGTDVLGRPAGTRDLCSDVFPADYAVRLPRASGTPLSAREPD